ncbi:MAG: cellulase family glycosylhydrolase [Chloroflexi bacterium]|nr:cellulase family glycosylhydrolase [Chloroflexota bacterium]
MNHPHFVLHPSPWLRLSVLLLVLWLVGCQREPVEVTPTAPVVPATMPASTAAAPTAETVYLPLTNNSDTTPTATPTPLASPTATATPAYPPYTGPTLNRQDIGVQIYLHRVDVPVLFDQLDELGVGWVKVQVSWKLYQPAPTQYSDELFGELDQLVQEAQAHDIAVLLSVSKAPEWSRPTTELDGPPLDLALFQQFMQTLALRYQGQVAAYELWNEPNLQREWNGMTLDAAAFVTLIRAGAEGVRAADPAALVISGAPAVTGINDGLTAIDDRSYFRAMLAADVAQVVDGFGVHPYGWANPPDSTVANPDPAIPSHNNHPSFFFQDTLRDYGALLTEFGLTDKPLWVTEFGWGSFAGMGAEPPPEAAFMAHVSAWQQAVYTQRALELAHDWPWVGPMMLWNFNFAPWIGPQFSESGYSLLGPDGSPRPAYFALAAIPKE